MAKGLIIFKAFTGVGSVAAAGAGTVVAVKSGIFLKKDGDKLVQHSESLDTGELGQHDAGDGLDNGGDLSSVSAPDVQQAAAPVPSDPTKNADGVGDVDGEDKTDELQITPAGEGAYADSDEASSISESTGHDVEQGSEGDVNSGEDSGTAAHTDESQAAPGGATGGAAEKDSDVNQPSSLSDLGQESLEDSGDEGGKTSALSLTPSDGVAGVSVSTAGDDVKTVAPGVSAPVCPVVNPADSVDTNTPQSAAGAEGESGDGAVTGAVGGGGAGALPGSSTETGGSDNQ